MSYELKAQVIESGLVKRVKQLNRNINFSYMNSSVSCSEFIHERDALEQECPEEYKEAVRVMKADFARSTRLKKRIEFIMSLGECTFLTLTFNDDVLDKTSSDTRRQHVFRYLKTQSSFYVANIDFGSKHGREHYHAIILGRADLTAWHDGAINAKPIISSSDPLRLGHYINKLVNHAIKETTKRNHIIYSRHTFEEILKLQGKEIADYREEYYKYLETGFKKVNVNFEDVDRLS